MTRLLLLSVLLVSASAAAEEPFELRWKLSSSGVWPPALAGDRLVVKTGDTLAAYSVSSGRLLWTQTLGNLRLGEGTLAIGDRFVYVLGKDGLQLLDAASGQPASKRPLRNATGVLFSEGALYLASAAGLQRLDEAASKLLQQAPGFQGELRGADGDYVAIYRHQAGGDPKASPKRLTVVNLRTAKTAFEFKLLPNGWHRVARMAGGRIAFIDYTQRQADGSNLRKLYYTEADYRRGKKLRDVSLATKYSSAAADVFWISAGPSGPIYFANHGKPGEPSTLFAYDPEQGKTLWTRSGEVAGMGLLLYQGRLWTGLASAAGGQVVAYSPSSGDVIARLAIDAAGTSSPVGLGQSVLVRTRSSIYCVAPRSTTPATATPGPARWQLFRDRVAGYLIQVPSTWTFNRDGMRKLGGVRFVIPFLRSEGGAAVATLHVLTWEAANRDAEGLWRSVYAQRLRTDPRLKVERLTRLGAQGGPGGPPAVLATYSYRTLRGEPVRMRSLCVVSHGVAFELRGWVAPFAPPEAWQEIEGIFSGFQPKAPGAL